MKTTKYETTYRREFSEREVIAAAKAAFILDLGGVEGMQLRGLKESAIKINHFTGSVTCTVTSAACAIEFPIEDETI